jgi:ubiquitin carboxyl-terminal hydrolase 9/24
MANEIIGRSCMHRYEHEEPYLSMSVTIRNNKNLQEALDVKGDLLSDDNAYSCEKCQKKVDAIKRTCIKTLPDTLVIQLKRFDYDWDNGRPIKLNDHFVFPIELDMEPYTVEALAKRDREQHQQTATSEAGPAVEEAQSTETKAQEDDGAEERGTDPTIETETTTAPAPSEPQAAPPPANSTGGYLYTLAGVIVHSGVANAGHYYSFIRIRDPSSPANGKWLKFNDTDVEVVQLTEAMMEKEFFGGKQWTESQVSSYSTETERNWSAYMLFYDRHEQASAPVPEVNLARFESFETLQRDSSK